MGLYNFIWDAAQSGQIRELQERVEKLEEQTEILYEWVQYFRQKEQNEQIQNQGRSPGVYTQSNGPTETST